MNQNAYILMKGTLAALALRPQSGKQGLSLAMVLDVLINQGGQPWCTMLADSTLYSTLGSGLMHDATFEILATVVR